MGRVVKPMRERLLAKREINDAGCWIWTGAATIAGYGQIRVERRNVYVHREAARVFLGADITGRVVCHRCDTPRCFNPDHLFVGDHADNVADKCAKRRQAWGATNGHAKLTEADIRRIRRISEGAPRGTTIRLAREYGVSRGHMSMIVNRLTWKYVDAGHLAVNADVAEREKLDQYDAEPS
jgi:hypothetical protein